MVAVGKKEYIISLTVQKNIEKPQLELNIKRSLIYKSFEESTNVVNIKTNIFELLNIEPTDKKELPISSFWILESYKTKTEFDNWKTSIESRIPLEKKDFADRVFRTLRAVIIKSTKTKGRVNDNFEKIIQDELEAYLVLLWNQQERKQ